MKKFFIESRMLGKSLSLTLILLLAVNCQTDESADIGIKENLPTEGIDAQSQARAREIVNSEEYENAMNQMEMFISKVNDEHFFTGELFNVEKETYNYNVINERLSMTSFKSAEEFIREYEKMYYSFQDFFISYPNLTKSELLLDNFNNEAILNNIDSFDARGISCWQQCFQDYNICQNATRRNYIIAVGLCGFAGVITLTGPLGTGTCFVGAWLYFKSSERQCRSALSLCRSRC